MATDILTNTSLVYEGNGAYRINGNTIYKGENVDNYVSFSNMLWRIIKIKSDNTIVMMLDDYINILPWNEEYTAFTKSDIFNYLNDIFIKSFNTEKLAKTTICEDDINSMTTISCSKMNLDNYISLLDISDYVNSIVDDKTFLSKEEIEELVETGHISDNFTPSEDTVSLKERAKVLGVKGYTKMTDEELKKAIEKAEDSSK